MRQTLKAVGRALALAGASPFLVSFWIRAPLIGRNRALEGSTQALACWPGLLGQYLRRAFLQYALAYCDPSATIEFGTIFSQSGARVEAMAYIGPGCHIGLAHIGRDVLLAAGVHVPSGRRTHAFDDPSTPIRAQTNERTVVTIGAGAWVGSAAVVMADVGEGTVVGAGAVVTKPLPAFVVAVGVPARIVRARGGAPRNVAGTA